MISETNLTIKLTVRNGAWEAAEFFEKFDRGTMTITNQHGDVIVLKLGEMRDKGWLEVHTIHD